MFLQMLALAMLFMLGRPRLRRILDLCRHTGPTPQEVIDRVTESVPRQRLPADQECVICLRDQGHDEELATGESMWRGLPCGHAYHEECIDEWLRQQPRCPLCRESLLA